MHDRNFYSQRRNDGSIVDHLYALTVDRIVPVTQPTHLTWRIPKYIYVFIALRDQDATLSHLFIEDTLAIIFAYLI